MLLGSKLELGTVEGGLLGTMLGNKLALGIPESLGGELGYDEGYSEGRNEGSTDKLGLSDGLNSYSLNPAMAPGLSLL